MSYVCINCFEDFNYFLLSFDVITGVFTFLVVFFSS